MSAGPGPRDGRAREPQLGVDHLLDDPRTRILVCCGSGGVGKTTVAAALGVRGAERGRKVVVLTVDPARRLAQSMGLNRLDNNPRRVSDVGRGEGELYAMTLDMKRTFDEIVEAHAEPERAHQILENPFYQSVSSSFAGTQEYMAMEKLGQLRARGQWDLIVVDTPPSRSALDFLDAPRRLGDFLDGRFIRLLLGPARRGGRAYVRALGSGVGLVTGVLTKVLGTQVLRDAQTFVSALDTVFGGFRERADATYRLLQAPGTGFLVVAAPERDALREASYFASRLDEENMPLVGLVLNRVHHSGLAHLSAARSLAAAEALEERDEHPLAAGALRLHAERTEREARENRLRERFTSAHPGVPIGEITAKPTDVHDLDALRVVSADIASGPTASTADGSAAGHEASP